MIRRDGYVKVLDFGVATLARLDAYHEAARAKANGADTFGSVNYMAPEQAAGTFVDGLADLYSLAVVLHEMVTGARPGRTGRDAQVRAPHPLTRLLERGLAADPSARHQSTGELARDLEDVQRSLEMSPPRHWNWRILSSGR